MMKKKIVAIVLSIGMTFSMPAIASAESLEERITALEKRVAELEEMVGVSSETEETEITVENETSSTENVEEEAEPVLMETQQFIADIAASYNARSVVANRYTVAEINTMTDEEYVKYSLDCVEAEREFYEKYQNAKFEDLNIQYLCNQYIGGLNKQYQTKDIWNKSKDRIQFDTQYTSGYYNRAYVIVELTEYYGAPFTDISDMKANTEAMDSINEAETRNAAVDHATVKKTQELLNGIGFFCGNADGISGKRTVKSIKRFQEMYGYEPVDGMIDDELIGQLEVELAKKQ
ncbi:peptidoglycan-binding domain-containing protein [Blautia sp. HCP3S3_G3]|uniref:peptidoglycan-binding domain-containing protein n=1 Tax=Blautia sp. HCP3S3_G3 TaxID=3438913 RepID=UPI003F8A4D23